ncbi:MAG: hypothetical protein LBR61_11755, partial [Synergistaceae bacterium]|nr:hypothetical protein [Synergistaceae bacterium]
MKRKMFGAFLAAVVLLLAAQWSRVWAADREIVRMGVMKFVSKTSKVSTQQADAITDFFTRNLANSKSIALIERERLAAIGREQKLNMSGLVDPNMAVEIGRLAGCQYILLGSVTSLTVDNSTTGISVFTQTKEKANATVDMRVLNTTTGEVALALSEVGAADSSAAGVNIGGLKNVESSGGDIGARALEAAILKLANRIKEEFAGEYSHVVSVSGKNVNISVGATSGARKGDLYLIYAEGPELFDMDGDSLGREVHPIAAVKVNDVQGNFSSAQVIANGDNSGLIRRGDKIKPTTSGEIKGMEFPRARPGKRTYDDTANQLFGNASGPEASAPAYEAPRTDPTPAPAKTSAGGYENESTDPAKVIPTYPLSPEEINLLRITHSGLARRSGKEAYDRYVELAGSYDGDYLAAYRAGELARQLKKNNEATEWFNRA